MRTIVKQAPERIAERREEIMNACQKLYRTMSFRQITLKEIGNEVPFSRPTIYNYFETKEEIFLGLFEREYRLWARDLAAIACGAEELPAAIAQTLAKRELMLRLLAVNLYDMEENSRIERLVEFKQAYRAAVDALDRLLATAFPQRPEEERTQMLVSVLAFLHGVYPFTHATEKQRAAMEQAGVRCGRTDVFELAQTGLNKILK